MTSDRTEGAPFVPVIQGKGRTESRGRAFVINLVSEGHSVTSTACENSLQPKKGGESASPFEGWMY